MAEDKKPYFWGDAYNEFISLTITEDRICLDFQAKVKGTRVFSTTDILLENEPVTYKMIRVLAESREVFVLADWIKEHWNNSNIDLGDVALNAAWGAVSVNEGN